MSAPIIDSLLETDLYKFTMWQTMLHRHPGTSAEYRFICRNEPVFPLAELASEIERELDHLCGLQFRAEELEYLRSLRFIKPDFLDFLRVFRFHRPYVQVRAVPGESHARSLEIIAKGPMVHTMGFEIFVLAIVNELYFRRLTQGRTEAALTEGRARLAQKIATLGARSFEPQRPFVFFDFGLRRRFSGAWHDEVVRTLQRELPGQFRGTSNVRLAARYDLVPIGTMAHEYLQAYQALGVRLRDSQRAALEDWVQEYRGDLGIALTDVIHMAAFLRDFDLYFAKLFDGLRHDSGDPFAWAEQALAHYAALRIDPRDKRLVFSDGLDVERALALYDAFSQRAQTFFGIGTHLSNDVGEVPLSIVMKLQRCNDQPVAKISDAPGKTLCDDQTFLAYLRQVFER